MKQKISCPQDRLTGDHAPAENKSSDRREGAAHKVDEDLCPSDVDAGHQSDLLVSANGVDRPADGRSGQHEMADCDEDRSNDEGYGQRSQKAAAEPEEPVDVRLRQTENGRAAGIDHGSAGDHVEHAEGDNERLDLKAPDQNPVGQSDQHARSNPCDGRQTETVIEHDAGRDHANEADDRALRKVEAAHQMMAVAARKKDSGERNDLEAGMAKYLASEYAKEVVEDSFRIHGGYGFSKEYEIERLYREVPMLLIGEGTAEIQKMIIGRRLLEEYRIPR